MKKLFNTASLLSLSLLLISGSCQKAKTKLTDLPPATQEGKNTFGCVINSKAFIAQTNAFSYKPAVTSQYGYINSDILNGHYFKVFGSDTKTDVNKGLYIRIYTYKLDIKEGGGYIHFKISKTAELMLNTTLIMPLYPLPAS
jgi:hypothetical protein